MVGREEQMVMIRTLLGDLLCALLGRRPRCRVTRGGKVCNKKLWHSGRHSYKHKETK